MVLTMIVQSSSATLGITIGLAATGVIEFQTAAALVMGENIGTTITAWLASLGTTATAKRAAYAHVFFNVFGTMWFIALFPIAIKWVSSLIAWRTGFNPLDISIDSMDEDRFSQVITAGIALTHTSFNVANVVLFLPFAGLLGKFVTRLVPDKAVKEIGHLTYLDVRMLDTPTLSIVQSHQQINFMGDSVSEMMDQLQTCLKSEKQDSGLVKKIFHREEILDNVQKEIFVFLSNLVSGQVPHDITKKAHMQMRIADEYESLSDYVANVLKGIKKLDELGLPLDEPAREKLLALHARVSAYIQRVNMSVKDDEKKNILTWATDEGTAIGLLMKDFRRQHLERLQNEEVSPFFSLAFTDILNYYRRMKDHALNIAEVVAGEK
jgi:phosphate:Na+ symporter